MVAGPVPAFLVSASLMWLACDRAVAAPDPAPAAASSPVEPGEGAGEESGAAVDSGPPAYIQTDAAQRTMREQLVGYVQPYTIRPGETLMDVAARYDLGVPEIRALNPEVDPWVPGVGREIVLPMANILPDAPKEGIVINLAELRLYFYGPDGVRSHAIGVGRDGFMTPLGETKVVRKKAGPTWYPTAATRADKPELPSAVPPGPDNPLGAFALYLGWPTYLMHGTNKEDGVGRRVSRGCIRLYAPAIKDLFSRVPVGTKVNVVRQPLKLGWSNGDLYLEVHPNLEQLDDVEATGQVVPMQLADARDSILAAAGEQVWRLNWDNIEAALKMRQGVPVLITQPELALRN